MAEEDFLYGKNRHLFGGIEPTAVTDMTVQTVSLSPLVVAIAFKFPTNTVVSGQNLCYVEGVKVLRKIGGLPENEFDGTVVADVKNFVTTFNGDPDVVNLTDVSEKDANPKAPICYAAFPYTTQGVYLRSPLDSGSYAVAPYTMGSSGPDSLLTFRAYQSQVGVITVEATKSKNVNSTQTFIAVYRNDRYPVCQEDGTLGVSASVISSIVNISGRFSVQNNKTYFITGFMKDDKGVMSAVQHAMIRTTPSAG